MSTNLAPPTSNLSGDPPAGAAPSALAAEAPATRERVSSDGRRLFQVVAGGAGAQSAGSESAAPRPLPGLAAVPDWRMVNDTEVSVLRLEHPNGGEFFLGGEQVTIRWTSSDSVELASHYVLVSTDGGYFWSQIAMVDGQARSCNWTVPFQVSGRALVCVVARDTAGNLASDRSDAYFTIFP